MIYFRMSRAGSPGILSSVFIFIFIFSITAGAQTLDKEQRASPEATPDTSQVKPKAKPSLEKKFVVNILEDQRAIWTSPFHWHGKDAKWLVPLGLSTVALITTDRQSSGELVEQGDNYGRLRISRQVSYLGSTYSTAGAAGLLYLAGRVTHNDHLRETGLLGAEALIDSGIVVTALKTASQRQRPPEDNSSGEFFDGGSAFPSGHAIGVWSLATVIAQEYGRHRPLVQVGAYGLATAVSLSRYTGRNHFLSDVLIGSAMGYGIGRYVYHKRHDPALGAENEKPKSELARSSLFPALLPVYSRRAHVYGAALQWQF